jgi:hypothetical protein
VISEAAIAIGGMWLFIGGAPFGLMVTEMLWQLKHDVNISAFAQYNFCRLRC